MKPAAAPVAPLDVEAVRRDFPILSRQIHGRPLVYLDSATSAQKPKQVIEAELEIYTREYANVHRGIHWLSERATERVEGARERVRAFINARAAREIIFTRNATEAINLVAASYGRSRLKAGDEVLLSEMEHHSNIVPWQMLREEKGIVLKIAPITDSGELGLGEFAKLIGPRTRLVAVTHMSNVLGTITAAEQITRLAHAAGAVVLFDGCQAIAHLPVDVQALGCDFYAFSGHKLYGPSGVGVLYGREELLDAMPPYQTGGMMIRSVSFERTTFADLPHKFEAGTPAIAQAVALGAAVEYVEAFGFAAIHAHEQDLLTYAVQRLAAIEGLRFHGTAPGKGSVLSFTLDAAHPHDIATILDRHGVAVRAGHHCAQPLMQRLGVTATARASFALYNKRAEIDALAVGLEEVNRIFAT
jgi:cysteine desulfurase / selenocysteine lyase